MVKDQRVLPCKVVTDVRLHTIGFDCNQRKISVDIFKYIKLFIIINDDYSVDHTLLKFY